MMVFETLDFWAPSEMTTECYEATFLLFANERGRAGTTIICQMSVRPGLCIKCPGFARKMLATRTKLLIFRLSILFEVRVNTTYVYTGTKEHLWDWGGGGEGGTKHFFLLILYNFRNIGGPFPPDFVVPDTTCKQHNLKHNLIFFPKNEKKMCHYNGNWFEHILFDRCKLQKASCVQYTPLLYGKDTSQVLIGSWAVWISLIAHKRYGFFLLSVLKNNAI